MIDLTEKRATRRIRIHKDAILMLSNKEKHWCTVFDISKGGFGIMCSKNVTIELVNEIIIPKMHFKRLGIIKNIKIMSAKSGTLKANRYGFEFKKPMSLNELEKFLTQV